MFRLCVVVFSLLSLGPALRGQVFSDPNFVEEFLYFGNGIVAIDFLPDGTLLAAEKRGVLIAFSPDGQGGFNQPVTLLDLDNVFSSLECGLLGLAVDPEYGTTGHIYLFYSTSADQRLTRVTYTGTPPINPATEEVLLSGLPRSNNFHKGGDIEFHPSDPDAVYIALGDDGDVGNVSDTDVPKVQSPDFYAGKILKVAKDTGLGLPSNPYYIDDADTIRARVWAVGFRNPFRIAFHPDAPVANVLYSSENGDGTDRLSWVQMGSNGGWSSAGDNGGFLDPADPNHRVLATPEPSRVGIIIATEPPFAIDGIATLYNGKWFGTDNSALYVERWHLTGADLDVLAPIAADNGANFIDNYLAVDMVFGPDGHLYTTETGVNDSIDNGAIRRIKYVGGTPPTAAFSTNPSPAEGPAPLTVQFTDQSTAGSSAIDEWEWDFGNGTSSTMQNPEVTFLTPGVYTVQLRVHQTDGLSDLTSSNVTVTASNMVNVTGTIFDGNDPANVSPLAAQTRLAFYQADGETPVAIVGGVGDNGNEYVVQPGGAFDADIAFSLTGDAFVVSAGEGSEDGVSPAKAGFVVASARGQQSFNMDFYLADAMIVGRVLDMRGEPIEVDLGAAADQQGTLLTIAGGRDFNPPFQQTGVEHRVTTDELGYFHVAVPSDNVGTTLYFDLVGDTGNDIHIARTAAAFSIASESREVEYRVGTYGGGLGCDDLDGIAETPDVDFISMIQPIFSNNCTGCHSGTGSQNGGLDLTGNAIPALVNRNSSFVPNHKLVFPGNLERSYLFEKVNCAEPQYGSRMTPGAAIALEDQALIRDWIMQLGESSCLDQLLLQTSTWPESDIRPFVEWVSENCD